MLMIWAVENVGFEPLVNFCSQGDAALYRSSRFLAQVEAFQTRLSPTGFLTVL
jgi:hypothetical protein